MRMRRTGYEVEDHWQRGWRGGELLKKKGARGVATGPSSLCSSPPAFLFHNDILALNHHCPVLQSRGGRTGLVGQKQGMIVTPS